MAFTTNQSSIDCVHSELRTIGPRFESLGSTLLAVPDVSTLLGIPPSTGLSDAERNSKRGQSRREPSRRERPELAEGQPSPL